MAQNIVLSGCSGGGKSTLLMELKQRGHNTVDEPGRRAIADGAVPWEDMFAFACRCLDLAALDFAASSGLTFYDRSALDALIWFDRAGAAVPQRYAHLASKMRYHPVMFLTPPWPEIYEMDAGRKHGYAEALAEYDALCDRLPDYGYETVEIPKASVAQRADWIEAYISS